MSDTTTPTPDNDPNLDQIEEDEDKREEAQFDKSIEEDGLLPAPEVFPTDGPAPAA